MARIREIFASGTLATVIFYQFNGRPCVRSKPARVKQTTATKNAYKQFGLAKTVSRLLRESLEGLLPQYRSRAVMYSVDKGIIGWMRTVQSDGQEVTTLPGFRCTGEEDYSDWLSRDITALLAGTTLQVTVPSSEKIPAPAGCNKIEVTLVVSCIDPTQNEVLRNEEQTIEISLPPVGGAATVLSFEVVVQEGVFITLSAGLCYGQMKVGKEVVMNKPDPKPVVVLSGWYCGK